MMLRLIAVFVFMSVSTVFAQQDPQFSQYQDYSPYINPSFIVNDYQLNADVQHRQQWVGFDGRPISTAANVSYEVKKAHSAFGITYLIDALGAQYSHNARLNYAGAIRFRGHTIAPGIYMGVLANHLDGSQLNPVQSGDQNIITSNQAGVAFDIGVGLSYRFKGLVVGFSASHLAGPTLEYAEGGNTSEVTIARHYYGLVRYDFEIGRVFRLKPLSFVKTDAASAQFDQWLFFGADNLTKVLHRVNIGVGYRIDDAVMVSAELVFKWFRFGYSYDITTSGLNSYSNGSHEITLRMHLFPVATAPVWNKASKALE
jgi:type IX secretion system PorP/SprF family membrane protein